MDFADLPNYPMVANTDYSPTNDAFAFPDTFDKAYLADSYTSRPDYTFETMFDTNPFIDRPLSSIESPADYPSQIQPLFTAASKSTTATTTSPTQDTWTANSTAGFARSNNFNGAFATSPSFNDTSDSFHVTETSTRDSSPTPSLCGDGPRPQQLASPSLSPRSLKRESPEEASYVDEEPAPKRSQKKRGRPRLDRNSTESTYSSASSKARTVQRLPHNQVERKYREGLNAELERLRRAVPTLIQRDSRDLMSPPKPSKATILASAIDYIQKIEQERDQLREENETLKGLRSTMRTR